MKIHWECHNGTLLDGRKWCEVAWFGCLYLGQTVDAIFDALLLSQFVFGFVHYLLCVLHAMFQWNGSFFSEFIHFNAVSELSTLFICPSVCIVCNAFVSKRILSKQQRFSHMPTAHIGVCQMEFHAEYAFPKRFNENGFHLKIHVLFGDQLINFAFEMPTKNWLNHFGPPRFDFN